MSVTSEPFAAVYEDRNRLGVIVARTGGGGGFEAYAGTPARGFLLLSVRRSEADQQRRLDQGGIRDESGPNRGLYCPKSRRRDGGACEAVSRHPTNHAYLDRLTVPSDSIVWRPRRRPRTEA
jgi:hypothetical protein